MCGAISRVMSFKTIICLGRLLPAASSDLPGDRTGRPMVSIFGLASDGVYMATCCYQRHGGLLHRLFTLTTFVAVIFCCTFLRVTSTGRYPASCPVKPGLSSPAAFRHLQPRTSVLLASNTLTHFFYLVKSKVPRQRSDPFRRPLSSRAGHTAHSGDGRHDLSPR